MYLLGVKKVQICPFKALLAFVLLYFVESLASKLSLCSHIMQSLPGAPSAAFALTG